MIITVTNTNDSGAGSLRQAIANAVAGDTIAFASGLANQTITLTSGQLTVNKNLIFDGAAAANLKISGNNASRVFEIQALQATFRNLIITNGRVIGNNENGAGAGIKTNNSTVLIVENCQLNNNVADYGGGAIFSGFQANTTVINSKFNSNNGTGANTERGGGAIATKSGGSLIVKGSEFTNNKGINGGAINSLLGTLTVENSIFKNNDTIAGAIGNGTMGYGGAIYTDGANASGANSLPGPIGGTITISNSQFDGNKGAGQGGAMFLFGYSGDKVIVDKSTITNNQVIKDGTGNALGGGIRIGVDQFSITNTTIANNTALSQGGGLWIGENSKGTITNNTISGNKADDGSGNGLGGAILFANGSNPVSLTNNTIAYNRAGFQGGAFWGGGSNITLKNTIVGYSTAGNPWGVKINTGTQFTDGGGNLQWPPKNPNDSSDMNITGSSSLIIADPKLDPTLKDNGGGILTHALLAGSPAINTGTTTTLTTDARGFNRDSKPDIGAFEYTNNIINGSAGNDTLNGSAGNDIINGFAGNDILNGGAGIDTLIGGTGNDIYVVDTTTDVITENANEGTDTIQSSVTFTLATLPNIENLTLTGTAAINGTGNAGNNVITGNTANNILNGGAGIDTLIGGTGIDRFDYRNLADSVFNSVDVITDFNAAAGNDLFLIATARSVFSNAGNVTTFDPTGITAKLTTVNFGANAAAQFTFGSRTFVAINDATAGFSATTDAIIEVTGLTGTLSLTNFTTVTV